MKTPPLLLCLMLAAPGASAQTALSPSDPQARSLLLQTVNAYKNARSYRATITAEGQDSISFPSRVSVAWQRPDRFAVTVAHDKETDRFVSDGAAVQVTSSHNPGQFLRTTPDFMTHHASESPTTAFGAALTRIVHNTPFWDARFLNPDGHWESAFTGPSDPRLPSATTLGPDQAVDGVACHTVIMRVGAPDAQYQDTTTLALGADDHLIHRVVDVAKYGAQDPTTNTLTYHQPVLNAALPARQFALVAPPGAERVDAPGTGGAKADPRARALMAQMQDAYKALTSFACTATDTSGYTARDENHQTVRIHEGTQATYAVSGPGRVHFTRTTFSPASENVKTPIIESQDTLTADGQFAYITVSRGRTGRYLKIPVVESGRPNLWMLANWGGLGQSMSALNWMPHSALGFTYMPADGDYAWQMGTPTTVNGEAVDAVVLHEMFQTSAGLPDKGGITLTLLMGRQDHLLRQVRENTVYGGGQGRTTTETYTDVKANPALPDSLFTFVPGAGAEAVSDTASLLPPRPSPPPAVGSVPPALPASTVDFNGGSLSLDTFQGRVVLLDFWATWCPPCREEVPFVAAAFCHLHAQGFDIVGVCYDKPADLAKVKTYMAAHSMAWPQTFDADNALGLEYGPQGIPFTILIGRDGKVAATGLRGPALAPAIAAALQKPASQPQKAALDQGTP